jgi:uncharacterized protein YukE
MAKSSLEAMDHMSKTMNTAISALSSGVQKLRKDYDTAGSTWDDAQYKALGRDVDQIDAAITKCNLRCIQAYQRISILHVALEAYLEGK